MRREVAWTNRKVLLLQAVLETRILLFVQNPTLKKKGLIFKRPISSGNKDRACNNWGLPTHRGQHARRFQRKAVWWHCAGNPRRLCYSVEIVAIKAREHSVRRAWFLAEIVRKELSHVERECTSERRHPLRLQEQKNNSCRTKIKLTHLNSKFWNL